MRRTARILSVLAVVALALAPALAEARPGGGASSGSRGARTFSAPPPTQTAPQAAQPMQRTQQAPAAAAAPAATAGAAGMAAAARPGLFQRNPFLAGLIGGGLIGMFLGAGFLGGGFAGLMGVLLQLALIGGLVFLVVTLLRRRAAPQPAGMPAGVLAREGAPGQGPLPAGGAGARRPGRPSDELGLGPADYQAFERLLVEVNAAWSREDLAALQRLATPEMVQYFRDDYAALAARGWKNETRDLRLEQGDLSEAWREGARDYATVAMRFSLVDVTREAATGRVTEGDPEARQTTTELWTFVRVQGGPWSLSAIQQAG